MSARRCVGLTLLELLVVVIIVGILAGIAIPGMQRVTEQGYKRHALDVLMAMYTGERGYFLQHQPHQYVQLTPTASNTEWRKIGMDNPNAMDSPEDPSLAAVQFSVSVNMATSTFLATAQRGTQIITIDQNRVFNEDSWP